MSVVIAIDAGTTGVRSRAIFADGRASVSSYREFPQYFPQPGWVEHDALEIMLAVRQTLSEVIARLSTLPNARIATIGITNQRETIVAWDKSTGFPFGRAIVWQDRRTADRCAELQPMLATVRTSTGLVLDPYFSGSKVQWMIQNGQIPKTADLAVGTIDAWIIWNLTGAKSFVTDPSNASRTMLFDINNMHWSEQLCNTFDVPLAALPTVVPSSGRCGVTQSFTSIADNTSNIDIHIPGDIPISGIAGDQQAALFGQACFDIGSSKNTYGTGSFVLMNVGRECPPPTDGMLTTVAWDLGSGKPTYALEGSIFVTGSAIQWLRDGLNIIDNAAQVGPLAASVADSGGVVVVPAFTGLGSPWWDPHARGIICGITRGTNRAHIARAVVQSMTFQTRDVVEAMVQATGVPLIDMRVDGGAAVMDMMLQMQADQLGVTVVRPKDLETTALGAAYLAGLAEGVWPTLQSITESWQLDRTFTPEPTPSAASEYALWSRAVQRSLNWAADSH
jgi:glycerol kinase